jgi:hypothetical protein
VEKEQVRKSVSGWSPGFCSVGKPPERKVKFPGNQDSGSGSFYWVSKHGEGEDVIGKPRTRSF